MTSHRKPTWKHVLFAILAGIASGCGSAPHDAAAYVPIGSQLSQLDQYLARGKGSEGEVTEWTAVDKGTPIPEGSLKNTYGVFRRKSLASYDEGNASPQTRDSFTGEIVFIHDGSTSADVNSLTYMKGKLVQARSGFLPG